MSFQNDSHQKTNWQQGVDSRNALRETKKKIKFSQVSNLKSFREKESNLKNPGTTSPSRILTSEMEKNSSFFKVQKVREKNSEHEL